MFKKLITRIILIFFIISSIMAISRQVSTLLYAKKSIVNLNHKIEYLDKQNQILESSLKQ